MRAVLVLLIISLISGCASAPPPPTLAQLPSNTPTVSSNNPSLRPTLPPTFTPTTPPTSIPTATDMIVAIETPTPSATDNPLGLPADSPENYPINVVIQGGGYALNLAPPPAVQYSLRENIYRFTASYVGPDQESLTLHIAARNGVLAGDYAPVSCTTSTSPLSDNEPICLSIVYTNDSLYAVATAGDGSLTIDSLDPLRMQGEIPLNDGILPGESGGRFNTAAYSVFRININGQQRTDG